MYDIAEAILMAIISIANFTSYVCHWGPDLFSFLWHCFPQVQSLCSSSRPD